MRTSVKEEIVTLGIPSLHLREKSLSKYVDPLEWNELLREDNTIVIDTRNDYEVRLGTFHRAIDPSTKSFREFPQFIMENFSMEEVKKTKKIAIFCTGGIRCEKAAVFLEREGFEKIYNLKGGILRYLEEMDEENSLFQGECFVFDQRTSVTHGLKRGMSQLCRGCRGEFSCLHYRIFLLLTCIAQPQHLCQWRI